MYDDNYTLEPGDIDRNGRVNVEYQAHERKMDAIAREQAKRNELWIKNVPYKLTAVGNLYPDGKHRVVIIERTDTEVPF